MSTQSGLSLCCDLEPVVHRMTQILLAAEIPLGGLDRDMAEQELNLFQFAAVAVAQLGAGSAKVMRGHMLQPYAAAVSIHHVPDNVHVDAITPNLPILAYGTEHSSGANHG